MKKITLVILIIFCFIFKYASAETIFLSPIKPKPNKLPILNPNEFSKYIDFVLKWSSYTYAGEPLPEVQFEKPGLVQVYAYGEYAVAQAEFNQVELPKIIGIYDRYSKKILISDDVDINDRKLEVTLIHEFVHYLQDINGYTESLGEHVICTESEAYDIQMLWQIENDIDTKSIPFVQERSLFSAMKCMGNQFN